MTDGAQSGHPIQLICIFTSSSLDIRWSTAPPEGGPGFSPASNSNAQRGSGLSRTGASMGRATW